jgi:hypothetical protein
LPQHKRKSLANHPREKKSQSKYRPDSRSSRRQGLKPPGQARRCTDTKHGKQQREGHDDSDTAFRIPIEILQPYGHEEKHITDSNDEKGDGLIDAFDAEAMRG